jgi:hypothetical protein
MSTWLVKFRSKIGIMMMRTGTLLAILRRIHALLIARTDGFVLYKTTVCIRTITFLPNGGCINLASCSPRIDCTFLDHLVKISIITLNYCSVITAILLILMVHHAPKITIVFWSDNLGL